MMEVWNTETEKAKAIIGRSRCPVTCTVKATGPILLASVRGLCLLRPGGRKGLGKAAPEQQTHESEVTSSQGMVNCDVLTGKCPELLPGIEMPHEPPCSFVNTLEGRSVALCRSRLTMTLAVNAVGRILLAFSGSRIHQFSCPSVEKLLLWNEVGLRVSRMRMLQRDVVLRCPARHDAVGWWRVSTAEDRVLQLHRFSCYCVERFPVWNATVIRVLEGWNTQTEGTKISVSFGITLQWRQFSHSCVEKVSHVDSNTCSCQCVATRR